MVLSVQRIKTPRQMLATPDGAQRAETNKNSASASIIPEAGMECKENHYARLIL